MTGTVSLWQVLFGRLGNQLLIALLPLYVFALIKGDKTDRACAHILAIGTVLYLLLALDPRHARQSWPYSSGQVGIDVLLLAAQTMIALRSSRRYPIIMAAAQLLIVIAGALAAAGLIAQQMTLAMMIAGAAIIQLGAFVVGLIKQFQRRRERAAGAGFAG